MVTNHSRGLYWLAIYILAYVLLEICGYQTQIMEISEEIYIYRLIGVMVLIITLLMLIATKKIVGTAFCPYTLFLISFVLFNFGQPIVYAFGLEKYIQTNIARITSYNEVIRASMYTLKCLVFLYLGSLLFFLKRQKNKPLYIISPETDINSVYHVGRIIFMICVLPMLLFFVYNLIIASKIGYEAINDRSATTFITKIMSFVSLYFQCSLVLCMVGSHRNRKRFNFYFIVMAIYALAGLMMGDRTEPTALLIFHLWLKGKYFGRMNIRRYIPLFIGSGLLLAIFPAIMKNRYNGLITFDVIWNTIKTEDIIAVIANSIAFLGYSIFPLTMTMRIVPSMYNFRYGLTYLMAFTGVIPYSGLANEYSRLGIWLEKILNMSYGPGYSIPAEAFINFGMFFMPIMLVIGYIAAKFLFVREEHGKFSYKNLMVVGMVLITQITLPRREFEGAVRDIFYIMLPIYIAVTQNLYQKKNALLKQKAKGIELHERLESKPEIS